MKYTTAEMRVANIVQSQVANIAPCPECYIFHKAVVYFSYKQSGSVLNFKMCQ